ncbi:MAG TPA: hypothetical protein VFZ11_13200 [Gemmatimonadaceae bacterium]
MERTERMERVQQLYGYAVCLIAVVVGLISVNSLVNQAFLLSNPLAASSRYGWGEGPLTSYEAYSVGRSRNRPMPTAPEAAGGAAQAEAPSEAELRAEFETLRADAMARARFEASRELTQSIVMLLLAVALFWWHWRWVRGAGSRADAARAAPRESAASG